MNIALIKKKIKNNKLAKLCRMTLFPIPYVKYYRRNSVNKNVILYESFYGRGMSCGPKAIFDQVFHNEKYGHFTHVWVYDNKDNWRREFEDYKDIPEVKFVKIKSRKYYKYLAESGYLINNSTFPPCFTRRPEQEYINTWHGIPLKLMGYEMPEGNIEVANTERNYLQTTYLLSPNEHHTKMYLDSYKLEGLYNGRIIETGQARTDTIFNTDRDSAIEELVKNGVNIQNNKKIIMYAPTWRGENFNNAIADAEEYIEFYNKVSSHIDQDKYQLIIKPHQVIYDRLKNNSVLGGLIVSSHVDTNKILQAVDILISDYSSIFFDFLVTERPVLFYIPDLDEYSKKRGLYVPIEQLPGPATDDIQRLCQWIDNPKSASEQYGDSYKQFLDTYCKDDDGHVTERIAETIFLRQKQAKIIETSTSKKKIFISLGRALQNGITHSFLSLLNNIDYSRFDVTAYLYEPVAPDQVERICQMNSNVRVLVRTNYTFATRRELVRMVVGMAFNARGVFRKVLPDKYFERQARRMVGDSSFDSVVEFCGYSPILAMVLPKMNASVKSIWMHNDLIADANRKIGHKKPLKRKMSIIFHLYRDWDRMVSCSHSVMEVNKKNLIQYGEKNKFYYAKNTINYRRVLDSLKEDVEYEGFPMPEADHTNFVTMGRLSTEKNHGRLINAFAQYLKEYPDGRLYILGDGPLRPEIEQQIHTLGLDDKVILTGNQVNPFGLMKKCQCFILPSLYEGQPMVLLEARIVGLPIIVSDFSSVTDSLMENGQYLIKSTEDSILDGLRAFEKGKVPGCAFDPKQYNMQAVNEFEKAIL